MKRPFAVFGLSMMASLIIATHFSVLICVTIGIILFAVAITAICSEKISSYVSVCLIAVATGMFIYSVSYCYFFSNNNKFVGSDRLVTGTVVSEAELSYDNYRYIIDATFIDGEKCNLKIRLTTSNTIELSKYDSIVFSADVKELKNVVGTSFDNVRYLQSQKIVFTAYCDSENIEILSTDNRQFMSMFDDLRDFFSHKIDLLFENEAAVVHAILLGDESYLTSAQNENFRLIGVSHLFAVSGLHLSVILLAFLWLCKHFSMHRVITLLIGIVLVFLFMALTGFPISVMRAGIMYILMLGGNILFKEADAINSLGIAVTVILILNPFAAISISMQMSVLATIGLVTVTQKITDSNNIKQIYLKNNKSEQHEQPEIPVISLELADNQIKDKEKEGESFEEPKKSLLRIVLGKLFGFIRSSFITTLGANIFLLPVYYSSFGYVSALMPIANLLLIPLGSALLIVSIVGVLLSLIPIFGHYISLPIAYAGKSLVVLIERIAKLIGGFSWQKIGITSDFAAISVFIVVIVTLLWIYSNKTKVTGKMALIICAVTVTICTVASFIASSQTINMYYWGNSTSACVSINGGNTSIRPILSGYYCDGVAENYSCKDNCFNILSPNEICIINEYKYTPLLADDGGFAAVFENDSGKILIVDSPSKDISKAIIDYDETFIFVIFRDDRYCDITFLLSQHITDMIYYSHGYMYSSKTVNKLESEGYDVYNINDSAGIKFSLNDKDFRITRLSD